MSARPLFASGRGNVVRLSDYRRSSCSATASLTGPTASVAETASMLARCEAMLYIGVTPDGELNFGLHGVQHDDAVAMWEPVAYLLGELFKIAEGS